LYGYLESEEKMTSEQGEIGLRTKK
jgi:hypothetical protein